MLVQSGFAVPWPGDALLPRVDVWDCLAADAGNTVALGRTKDDVAVRAGPWTVVMKVDATGRYPPYQEIIPRPRPG